MDILSAQVGSILPPLPPTIPLVAARSRPRCLPYAWLSGALAPPFRNQAGRKFFSGSMGITLALLEALGLEIGEPFDIKQNPADNILDYSVLESL